MEQVPQSIQGQFVQISVPNLIVIALMLVVFALAVMLPYPRRRTKRGAAAPLGISCPWVG